VSFTLLSLYSQDRRLGGPRAGLNHMAKSKFLTLPGLELLILYFSYILFSLYDNARLHVGGRRTSWELLMRSSHRVSTQEWRMWVELLWRTKMAVEEDEEKQKEENSYGPIHTRSWNEEDLWWPYDSDKLRGMLQVPIHCNNTSHFTVNIISYFSVQFFLI
jgi:hypothetical protein